MKDRQTEIKIVSSTKNITVLLELLQSHTEDLNMQGSAKF